MPYVHLQLYNAQMMHQLEETNRGSGNVSHCINNAQLNAYTRLYLNNTSGSYAISEVGQSFSGGGAGLNICTNTVHPFKLRTYINEAGAPHEHANISKCDT